MPNINQLNLSSCYGCTACASICGKTAIKMKPSAEGFLYPSIDESKCVDCGLCLDVCNIETSNLLRIVHNEPLSVYAAWNKQHEEVMTSTSGGIASLISYTFLNEGSIVYGAAFDENLKVKHIRITTIEELSKLKGSKYVQSDISGVFPQVKVDLNNGKNVLFIGTPCQVGGLKSYLRKTYDNLYTIDLICHGVPSPKMFKAYIDYIEKEEGLKISNYFFRKKKESGWRSYECIIFNNKKQIVRTSGRQSYSIGFYKNFFSRESCYKCGFSQPKRTGDITLSDFWGAEKAHKELRLQRKYGFNYLGINTLKGQKLFSMIEGEINFVESSLAVAIKGDHRFIESDSRPKIRNLIYDALNEKGYSYLVTNILAPQRDVNFLFLPNWLKNIIREIQNRL